MFLFNYLTTQNKPMSKTQLTTEEKIKGWTTLIVIVLMAVFYFKFCTGSNNETAATPVKKKPGKLEALIKSQSFVEQQLKAPKSAEFSIDYENDVTQIDDSTFSIYSYVDAQNNFGALLRNNYSCQLVYYNNFENVRCENLILLPK